MFTNKHACRRVVVLYQHIKTKHLRVYPDVTTETSKRGIVGVRLEILGCFDNGNKTAELTPH